jgi:hypothetical protein
MPLAIPVIVFENWGDVVARWPGDAGAEVRLQAKSNGDLEVSDLFRGGQPPGSAPAMLAAAIVLADLSRPARLRLVNILARQPTLSQLRSGVPPEETILGRDLACAALILGGRVVAWSFDLSARHVWLEGTIDYPAPGA